jgi:hypothetical protein
MYSTTPTATMPDGVQGTPYTVGQIEGVVNSSSFVVAIDVNTTGAASETLELFEVIVNGVVLYTYSGSANIGNVNNNGNGYADYTLGTVDLSGFADTAEVLFHARWSGAVDGAESFFLVGVEPVTTSNDVPEPGTLALLGVALGVAGWRRRRK